MGMAQSTEEQQMKCPLPGKPFIATPKNVANETTRANLRIKRLKEDLQINRQVGETVATTSLQAPEVRKDALRVSSLSEPPSHPTGSVEGNVEMTPLKLGHTEVDDPLQGVNPLQVLQKGGGIKALQKMKLSNKDLRKILQMNRIKVTHKGKYLNKKQMWNKIKMLKI